MCKIRYIFNSNFNIEAQYYCPYYLHRCIFSFSQIYCTFTIFASNQYYINDKYLIYKVQMDD